MFDAFSFLYLYNGFKNVILFLHRPHKKQIWCETASLPLVYISEREYHTILIIFLKYGVTIVLSSSQDVLSRTWTGKTVAVVGMVSPNSTLT